MTSSCVSRWEQKRTDETRLIEKVLREAGFERVDAYRYNSASIRVRVVDPRFEGLSRDERISLVEKQLEQLPDRTQGDILNLLTFAPSELPIPPDSLLQFWLNAEFDEPSPSLI